MHHVETALYTEDYSSDQSQTTPLIHCSSLRNQRLFIYYVDRVCRVMCLCLRAIMGAAFATATVEGNAEEIT